MDPAVEPVQTVHPRLTNCLRAGSYQVWSRDRTPRTANPHYREPTRCALTYLATDWMTLEEVSLMFVKRRSVPPRRMSRSPP